jgi:cobalt-zinc-cadmium resistance protein CzcA
VIVGGMFLSPICSLLVIPTLARMFMPDVPRTLPSAQPAGV